MVRAEEFMDYKVWPEGVPSRETYAAVTYLGGPGYDVFTPDAHPASGEGFRRVAPLSGKVRLVAETARMPSRMF